METKVCNICHKELPLTAFHKNAKGRKGRRGNCINCKLAHNRKMQRARMLRHSFGMTLEHYEAMVKEQNNLCLICEQPETLDLGNLAVDHCHSTGRIRGLLCRNCNSGLGYFKDNIRLFERAIAYLKARGQN